MEDFDVNKPYSDLSDFTDNLEAIFLAGFQFSLRKLFFYPNLDMHSYNSLYEFLCSAQNNTTGARFFTAKAFYYAQKQFPMYQPKDIENDFMDYYQANNAEMEVTFDTFKSLTKTELHDLVLPVIV